MGIVRALKLTGLTSGADHNDAILKAMADGWKNKPFPRYKAFPRDRVEGWWL
jgi:hypothetical protein